MPYNLSEKQLIMFIEWLKYEDINRGYLIIVINVQEKSSVVYRSINLAAKEIHVGCN